MNQDALRKGFQDLMQLYASRINQNAEDYANGRAILTLPSATIGLIDGLANTARQIFKSEPIVLRLKSPVIVVGDLHGHLLDLFRVLRRFGLPPSARYLFLGDIVDRGEFSTETIILVLLLKVLYPEHVHVIRGNHEFREISETHGFFDEVSKVYPTAMFDKFLDCFSPEEAVSILQRCKPLLSERGRFAVLECLVDGQKFPAAGFSLAAVSLYFTTMANGNSRFYRRNDLLSVFKNAGLDVEYCRDNVGVSHTLYILKPTAAK